MARVLSTIISFAALVGNIVSVVMIFLAIFNDRSGQHDPNNAMLYYDTSQLGKQSNDYVQGHIQHKPQFPFPRATTPTTFMPPTWGTLNYLSLCLGSTNDSRLHGSCSSRGPSDSISVAQSIVDQNKRNAKSINAQRCEGPSIFPDSWNCYGEEFGLLVNGGDGPILDSADNLANDLSQQLGIWAEEQTISTGPAFVLLCFGLAIVMIATAMEATVLILHPATRRFLAYLYIAGTLALSAIFLTISAALITSQIQSKTGTTNPFGDIIEDASVAVSTSSTFRAFTWAPVAMSWFSLCLTSLLLLQERRSSARRNFDLDMDPIKMGLEARSQQQIQLEPMEKADYVEEETTKPTPPHSEGPSPQAVAADAGDPMMFDTTRHSDVSSLSSDASDIDDRPGMDRRLSAL